jgi:hypothetical protein
VANKRPSTRVAQKERPRSRGPWQGLIFNPESLTIADVTSVDGIDYVFDPTKVSVVYIMPLIRLELPRAITTGLPGIAVQQQFTELEFKLESVGPPTTHVWGIVTLPVPILTNL